MTIMTRDHSDEGPRWSKDHTGKTERERERGKKREREGGRDERERETETETDRQASRQAIRQIDGDRER